MKLKTVRRPDGGGAGRAAAGGGPGFRGGGDLRGQQLHTACAVAQLTCPTAVHCVARVQVLRVACTV